MRVFHLRGWREAVFLVLGIAMGVAASPSVRRRYPDAQAATVLPPVVRGTTECVSSGGPVTEAVFPRQNQRRGPLDWQRVASEYQAAGGNLPKVHALLYQLDARALRKLALDAATWPRGGKNVRALREIYRRWAELDPLAALAQVSSLQGDTQEAIAYEAMRAFVNAQPQQAVAYFAAPPADTDASRLRNAADRRLMLNLALAAWSEEDSPSAISFLGQLPNSTLYPGPAGTLGMEYARQDLPAALKWATGLPEETARVNALQGVIMAWAETDAPAAADYALAFTGDADKGELVRGLISKWSEMDLPAAASWTLAQTPAVQAKAAGAVAAQWASGDPAGAATWASGLSGDARNAAFAAIAGNWYAFDPTAARNWLDGLSAGEARDAAVGSYLADYQNYDPPPEKLALAGTIGDAQKRDEVMVKVLCDWLSTAPLAARQWISQADLPAAVTVKLASL